MYDHISGLLKWPTALVTFFALLFIIIPITKFYATRHVYNIFR